MQQCRTGRNDRRIESCPQDSASLKPSAPRDLPQQVASHAPHMRANSAVPLRIFMGYCVPYYLKVLTARTEDLVDFGYLLGENRVFRWVGECADIPDNVSTEGIYTETCVVTYVTPTSTWCCQTKVVCLRFSPKLRRRGEIEQSLFASRVAQMGVDSLYRELEVLGNSSGGISLPRECYDLALAHSELKGLGRRALQGGALFAVPCGEFSMSLRSNLSGADDLGKVAVCCGDNLAIADRASWVSGMSPGCLFNHERECRQGL
jgi:hypothetical protein